MVSEGGAAVDADASAIYAADCSLAARGAGDGMGSVVAAAVDTSAGSVRAAGRCVSTVCLAVSAGCASCASPAAAAAAHCNDNMR